jgi:hypothetical protein
VIWYYPTLTLPLQRGGNKEISLPPLQGGIEGGKLALLIEPVIYPTLTLPLQRGGNKKIILPPLQGGIEGGKLALLIEPIKFLYHDRTIQSDLAKRKAPIAA